MIVKEIYLKGFRNFEEETINFTDGVNVIFGRNAQGKTNLIEAIYYFTAGRSFRSASDKELITIGGEQAYIRISIESGGREQILEAKLFSGRRREIYINNVKLRTVSELVGRLTAVPFCPDDLNMIKEGAAVRRKMMDRCLSQLRPGYLATLLEFGRLYENKTRILRDYREKPSLLGLLDDFDLRLAQQSARLICYRTAFSETLLKRAADIHNNLSSGAEILDIRYKTVGGMDTFGKKPEQILPELLEHQWKHRQAELNSGSCLSGAHKDDLEISINGTAARKFASQGQARTAVVSMKLAERDILYENSGENPILLLDDVLSELDMKRQDFILGKITRGQVFITCCDGSAAIKKAGGKIVKIEKGKLI
jgi:DNA replication and repair protein RecF